MNSDLGHSFQPGMILAGIIIGFIICAGCIQDSSASGTATQPTHPPMRGKSTLTPVMTTTPMASPSRVTVEPSPTGSSRSAGSLTIWSTPPACSVYIDGMYAGDTPPVRGSITKPLMNGPHTIRISKIGYEDYLQNVFISAGESVIITASLTEKPFPYYTLNPTSTVPGVLS